MRIVTHDYSHRRQHNNIYAQTANKHLFIDKKKKNLRVIGGIVVSTVEIGKKARETTIRGGGDI